MIYVVRFADEFGDLAWWKGKKKPDLPRGYVDFRPINGTVYEVDSVTGYDVSAADGLTFFVDVSVRTVVRDKGRPHFLDKLPDDSMDLPGR